MTIQITPPAESKLRAKSEGATGDIQAFQLWNVSQQAAGTLSSVSTSNM